MGKRNRYFLILIFIILIAAGYAIAATGEETGGWGTIIWHAVNFAILLGIGYYAYNKYGRETLKKRSIDIRKAIEESKVAVKEAEERFQEIEKKMSTLQTQIDELIENYRKEGELERERILKEARIAAERIKEQANFIAQQEIKKAKIALKEEAANLSLKLTEEIIKRNITESDHERMISEYIEKIKGLKKL